MEYYQTIQNRAGETAAVINQVIPTLTVGTVTAAGLLTQSTNLGNLAQLRDHALADFDGANNAENQGFLSLVSLVIGLPKAAEGELDDATPAESALLDLLDSAYAITPRTTELAMARGHKLVSSLTKINAYLAAHVPARPPITSAGRTVALLISKLAAQPALKQALEDRAADVTSTRSDLRTAATALDRLNKRFYLKLQGEARENPALATALGQITTEDANQPGTLGIRKLLQGSADNRHILLSYDSGTYDSTATSTVEWMVVGSDADFTHKVSADPSGNSLGPFAIGQTVKLRTRVTNANGTTTGSIRTLLLTTP